MPARPVAAVQFDLSSTPEQAACAIKIDDGLKTFWTVVEHMEHAADRRQPIPQVEDTIFRNRWVIGHWLLQAFLDRAGTGDVGPTLTVAADSPSDPDPTHPRREQPHRRPSLSTFGETAIERTCYGQDRVDAAPSGARLHRPQRQYPSLLQQWLGSFAVDDAHAEAIREPGTVLGLETTVRASEDLNREQAGDVEVFQDRLPVPDAADEGPLSVVTADCKGVPLVRKALPPDEETDTPLPALANRRRGKGETANKTTTAAVGAVYTIEPFVRAADDVIEGVMRKKARERRPRPQNNRGRAALLVGKVALFLWSADEVIRRHPQGSEPVIFLADGERAVHDREGEYLPEDTVCILDSFHVMGRLWTVARCFFDERTRKHEAHQWAEERPKRLPEGDVDAVIRGMRCQATPRGLKGQRRKTVRDAAGYYERNRDRMKSDEYLAAGYPLGSGVVEGACRHLVKDRMERTGMRRLPSGARAMLDRRATYLNGEWNAFGSFHVAREDERLYGKIREAG